MNKTNFENIMPLNSTQQMVEQEEKEKVKIIQKLKDLLPKCLSSKPKGTREFKKELKNFVLLTALKKATNSEISQVLLLAEQFFQKHSKIPKLNQINYSSQSNQYINYFLLALNIPKFAFQLKFIRPDSMPEVFDVRFEFVKECIQGNTSSIEKIANIEERVKIIDFILSFANRYEAFPLYAKCDALLENLIISNTPDLLKEKIKGTIQTNAPLAIRFLPKFIKASKDDYLNKTKDLAHIASSAIQGNWDTQKIFQQLGNSREKLYQLFDRCSYVDDPIKELLPRLLDLFFEEHKKRKLDIYILKNIIQVASKNSEFKEKLNKEIYNFYMGSDATPVQANGFILSFYSEFFYILLYGSFESIKEKKVYLTPPEEWMNHNHLKSLLDYVNKDPSLEIDQMSLNELMDLYQVLDSFSVENFKEFFESNFLKKIKENIDSHALELECSLEDKHEEIKDQFLSSVLDVTAFANDNQLQELKGTCFSLIKNKIIDFFENNNKIVIKIEQSFKISENLKKFLEIFENEIDQINISSFNLEILEALFNQEILEALPGKISKIIIDCELNDKDFEFLSKKFPNLKGLQIAASPNLTDKGWQTLLSFNQLKDLTIVIKNASNFGGLLTFCPKDLPKHLSKLKKVSFRIHMFHHIGETSSFIQEIPERQSTEERKKMIGKSTYHYIIPPFMKRDFWPKETSVRLDLRDLMSLKISKEEVEKLFYNFLTNLCPDECHLNEVDLLYIDSVIHSQLCDIHYVEPFGLGNFLTVLSNFPSVKKLKILRKYTTLSSKHLNLPWIECLEFPSIYLEKKLAEEVVSSCQNLKKILFNGVFNVQCLIPFASLPNLQYVYIKNNYNSLNYGLLEAFLDRKNPLKSFTIENCGILFIPEEFLEKIKGIKFINTYLSS